MWVYLFEGSNLYEELETDIWRGNLKSYTVYKKGEAKRITTDCLKVNREQKYNENITNNNTWNIKL